MPRWVELSWVGWGGVGVERGGGNELGRVGCGGRPPPSPAASVTNFDPPLTHLKRRRDLRIVVKRDRHFDLVDRGRPDGWLVRGEVIEVGLVEVRDPDGARLVGAQGVFERAPRLVDLIITGVGVSERVSE